MLMEAGATTMETTTTTTTTPTVRPCGAFHGMGDMLRLTSGVVCYGREAAVVAAAKGDAMNNHV
jgi:hypothetical protein